MEQALRDLNLITGFRAINLWSWEQFISKIFQRRIDLNIPDLIKSPWKVKILQEDFYKLQQSYLLKKS